MRGATSTSRFVMVTKIFQSTLPMRGATRLRALGEHDVAISIHAPHAGSDPSAPPQPPWQEYFNPRSPCGERLLHVEEPFTRYSFQSTLPMRGATVDFAVLAVEAAISIHAPHAGSDHTGMLCALGPGDFNPRSPCGERLGGSAGSTLSFRFQSTLPMRGATCFRMSSRTEYSFQSTLPMRGATERSQHIEHDEGISIHAPHAGSDPALGCGQPLFRDFNPRSPCGERLDPCLPGIVKQKFQSTLPMRGATGCERQAHCTAAFQSTLPMRGATRATANNQIDEAFQSTLPMRGATSPL